MKTLKKIELKRFNNYSDDEDVKVTRCYNFLPTNKLCGSFGIVDAKFPLKEDSTQETELNVTTSGITQVNGVTFFKQYYPNSGETVCRVLVYGDENKVYINQLFVNNADLFWLYNLQFNSAPICLCFKKNNADAVILTSEDKMMMWKVGYVPYQINGTPIITSMTMNDGVLYCTIKKPAFKVWYCKDLDAENVGNTNNTSGYISLEDDLGDARKVVTFNENVYVFRDYGITKINLNKNEISTNQIYESNTRIFTNTVSQCGNVIMFMAVDGLYSFNGVKVSRAKINLCGSLPIRNENAVASSLGNKYYLAFKLDFNDHVEIGSENANTWVNNCLLIYNITDGTYQLMRGFDIKTLQPVKTAVVEKMLVTFNSYTTNKLGEVVEMPMNFSNPMLQLWQSDYLCKSNTPKIFTKLTVNADAGVTFNLYGKNTYTFTTTTDGITNFHFKIYEEDLFLAISSSSSYANVEKLALEYYEY